VPGNILHPTVLAVHLRDDYVMGGCEQYRIRIPFEMVRSKVQGSIMDWVPYGYMKKWPMDGSMKTKPSDYDIWVLARHRPLPYDDYSRPPAEILDSVDQLGIKLDGRSHLIDLVRIVKSKVAVVLEYDDDHWGSRDFAEYRHYDLARDLLKEGSAITVTTVDLRNLVQKYAPGVPVYILPNCVRFWEWQGWDRWERWPDDFLVLGLTGSKTHYRDWRVLAEVLPRIMEEHENVALVLQGFIPDYLQPVVAKYQDRAYADDKFKDYSTYPGVIRQSDIALCPVDTRDEFNKYKSAIKAVEAMAAGRRLPGGKQGGAVPIVSDIRYYRRVVGSGNKRGIIVKERDPQAWYEAIKILIMDKDRRQRYARRGRAWVWKNRSIETKWRLWWDAYQEIYRRK